MRVRDAEHQPDPDGGDSPNTPLALITGSSGDIGRATIASFAARSFRIVAFDRRPLHDPPRSVALAETLDLLDERRVAEAVDAMPSLGRLQHVAVVAGGGDADELRQDDLVLEELAVFRRVIDDNLTTAFVTIRHCLPLLRAASGDRSVTLVGSINAFGGYGAPGYSAAKAGIIGLVNALAEPLGRDGIRINCLALGTTDTENLHDLARITGKKLDLSAVAEKAPLRRVLTPEEVGEAFAVMALDMSGLTGSTIVLDNGQTLIR